MSPGSCSKVLETKFGFNTFKIEKHEIESEKDLQIQGVNNQFSQFRGDQLCLGFTCIHNPFLYSKFGTIYFLSMGKLLV